MTLVLISIVAGLLAMRDRVSTNPMVYAMFLRLGKH